MQVADTEHLYFLPWRDADGYNIVDRDGVRVASVPHADARAYIIEAANAYPRLKSRLSKALEACRVLLESNRNPKDLRLYWAAVDKACEALEEAKRDG